MKKYFPVIIALIVVVMAGYVVMSKKHSKSTSQETTVNIGTFTKKPSCSRPPQFLKKMHIPQPVIIDLSQESYKGIALLYGKEFKNVLHPKQWEQYGHFSTYALDEVGNVYLVPMPFISIEPTTFNLQKNIYKLDTKTGKISIFMYLNDVHPSPNNPYGINAITYDCDDKTLWVSAIDESDYQSQKGAIYHISPKNKKVLQKFTSVDALSLALLKTSKGKLLLFGSARDNGLYAYKIDKKMTKKPQKILELPSVNMHIRKIKVTAHNQLELQTIPFSYSLIAQTEKQRRSYYNAVWDENKKDWYVKKK